MVIFTQFQELNVDKLLQDLDKYLDWLETPNENFGGRPVCPFLAPDRKSGKLKIEIYDPKVKTIWEHILIYDREDYNTALFLHIDDSIKEVPRAKWQTYLREGMRKIGLNHLKPICFSPWENWTAATIKTREMAPCFLTSIANVDQLSMGAKSLTKTNYYDKFTDKEKKKMKVSSK